MNSSDETKGVEGTVIQLTRLPALGDRRAKYKVLLDGQSAGSIRDCEVQDFPVAPGSHCLQLRAAWAKSGQLSFEVPPNKIAAFECRTLITPFNAFVMLLKSPWAPWMDLCMVETDKTTH